MKHAKHPTPFRATQIALALLVALAAAAAAQPNNAQTQPQAQQQQTTGGQQQGTPQGTPQPPSLTPRQPPPRTGPSYGPVLHPQPIRSEPGAQPEQSPQAQEEQAGGMHQQQPRHGEADPSARPAPQQQDPARSNGKQVKKPPQAARRSVQQRIDSVPQVPLVAGQPTPAPAIVPAQPAAVRPGPAQLNSCLGNTCTDTGGTTYQTTVGNAGVSSEGRLCTRSGSTVQCF